MIRPLERSNNRKEPQMLRASLSPQNWFAPESPPGLNHAIEQPSVRGCLSAGLAVFGFLFFVLPAAFIIAIGLAEYSVLDTFECLRVLSSPVCGEVGEA